MSEKQPKKPDWFNDLDLEPQDDFVSFKQELVHFLTFLNEGKKVSKEIDVKDKEGNKIKKEINSIHYRVIENGNEKDFNPISKILIQDLITLFPLTDRTFRVELIRGRTEVDNRYVVQELTQK